MEWVTQWDLQRLYPSYHPDMEARAVEQQFTEDKDLEVPTEQSEDGSNGTV